MSNRGNTHTDHTDDHTDLKQANSSASLSKTTFEVKLKVSTPEMSIIILHFTRKLWACNYGR